MGPSLLLLSPPLSLPKAEGCPEAVGAAGSSSSSLVVLGPSKSKERRVLTEADYTRQFRQTGRLCFYNKSHKNYTIMCFLNNFIVCTVWYKIPFTLCRCTMLRNASEMEWN